MYTLKLKKNIREVVTGFLAGIGLFYYEFLNNEMIISLEGLKKEEWTSLANEAGATTKDLERVLAYESGRIN